MATVTKNFKVKSGLIVEGATATVGGQDVLTKKQDDQDYIVGLIGGTSTSENTPNTVVKRDANGNFAAGTITADLDGTAASVDSLSGHSTTEISEGDNLYFTNQRAIDANTGLWDEAGSAADAESNAEGYADGLIATEVTNRNSAIATAKGEAIADAEDYTNAAISQEVSDRNSAISTAITDLDLGNTYDALGAADQALVDSKAYTDQEVAALVDGAPELLDTLNELAAAIADNPNYATDVANLVATKADTTYVDSEISDLDSAAQGYATSAENAARGYADSLASNYDAAGSAATAEENANDYTNSAISSEVTNRNNAIDSAVSDINSTIDALTTSDIAEGSNEYFTTTRAKSAAAALITGATKTNIVITGDENGLTITAENGVADSTTDDLQEGETNLYFTDSRAVDALEAVTPNFVEVELNSVAKQVAATSSATTASTVTAYSWAKADFRSAKFLVKVSTGTHSDVSEVILTLDSSDNVAITEYAMVGTNGALSTVSADVSGNNVRLLVTTTENNSNVTVAGTLLA